MNVYNRKKLQSRVNSLFFRKRCFDLCVVLAGGVILLPFLFFIAVMIWIQTNEFPFFAHKRIGKDNISFTMFKFRTMREGSSPYACHPTSPDDPRITPAGIILRKTNLDELPQIFNVLKGEMSLVGPRPEMKFITDEYSEYEQLRLVALPGITGPWQLSKFRGEPIHKHVELDLEYIQTMSLKQDITILIKTLFFLICGKKNGNKF